MIVVRPAPEATMTRTTAKRSSESGFAVLPALIVFALFALFAALGIPAFASQAKKAVLRQNTASLASQVRSYLALDLSPVYVADAVQPAGGLGNPAALSTVLAGALRTGIAGRFVNPFSSSRVIVCASAPPSSVGSARPAVWITDDAHYAYAAFRSSPVTKSQLAGTLVVVFGVRANLATIDVFYVDASGARSPQAAALAP
jgi:type II secretory pathway pseudopilin PulG